MQTECSNAFGCLITIWPGYFALFVFAIVIAARCCNDLPDKRLIKGRSLSLRLQLQLGVQQKRPIKLPASFIWRPFSPQVHCGHLSIQPMHTGHNGIVIWKNIGKLLTSKVILFKLHSKIPVSKGCLRILFRRIS